jgi:tetratricopeptide (TPR) repeat protein
MALSRYDVFMDQEQTASTLKPNPEDRNVSPFEMVNFVNQETELQALERTNGNLDTLRRLVAEGYPVIVELGLDPPGEYRWMGWYGHYLLVVAYDDESEQVWVYDSWFGTSEIPGENANEEGRSISYDDLDRYWRQFNRNYIVVYPSGNDAEIAHLIGPAMDDTIMWQESLNVVKAELNEQENDPFLWFNLGSVYNALGDYEKAAMSFDQARTKSLPWRMLWYQFGPYEAYYEAGRFEDVILLADITLMDRPYFEESYYYKGLALMELGEDKAAQDNLEKAVRFNPNFNPAVEVLEQLNS